MNEIIPSKTKVQSWRERIELQVKSNRSILDFCEEHHISRHTFSYWKGKLKKLKLASLTGRFIPMIAKPDLASDSPRIYLPNGVRIELGAGLESAAVGGLIRSLCGVGREGCAKS